MYYLKFENHKLSRSLFTLIIIGLFFNPYKSLSQPTKQTQAFDSIYFVTATQIANQDVNRALSIAGEKIIYKIENDQVRVLYKGLIYQEKAYYQQEYKNYEKAIEFANTAGEEFKKLDDPNTKLYYFATNEELIARLYLSIEKWDLANLHYNNLKDHLDKFPQKDMILQNFLYYGLVP